jgi:hypothetical protein
MRIGDVFLPRSGFVQQKYQVDKQTRHGLLSAKTVTRLFAAYAVIRILITLRMNIL